MTSSCDTESNAAPIGPLPIKQESTIDNSRGASSVLKNFIQEGQTSLKRKHDLLEEDEVSDCSTTVETETEAFQFPGLSGEHLDQEGVRDVDLELSQAGFGIRPPLEEVLNQLQNDNSENSKLI